MRTSRALPESGLPAVVTPVIPLPQRQAPAIVPLRILRAAMHPSVYKIALACWFSLLALFWVTFFVSANARFMLAISTVYATVFFGLPFILSRMRRGGYFPPYGLGDFIRGRFDTLYGPVSGIDALLQVVIVPLVLAVGGVAIALIIASARNVH